MHSCVEQKYTRCTQSPPTSYTVACTRQLSMFICMHWLTTVWHTTDGSRIPILGVEGGRMYKDSTMYCGSYSGTGSCFVTFSCVNLILFPSPRCFVQFVFVSLRKLQVSVPREFRRVVTTKRKILVIGKMPTCTCERELSDETNHVCPLKPTVDNDCDGKTREYDPLVRYRDGSVRLRNPNIELMDQDILYHLALGSGSHDLVEMFGDVKFVCMGGTPKRMEQFAHYIMKEIGHKLPSGTTLLDISQYSYRYSMYKVGPVLSISHGMGIPSVGILLHEVIKLMYHARVKDPIFFRIGTCGGIGLEGGTVVISEEAVDGMMKPHLELPVLGKMVRRPAKLDRQLARELKALTHRDDPYETVVGKTMCTYDFYEGQGRLDGAFCDFTENDKMEYLCKLYKADVVNIEMESLAFAALTHHAGIQSAVVCVALLDRLKGDQVLAPKEVLDEWQIRPQQLVSRYITRYLQRKGRLSLEGHGSMCVKSPRRFKLVQQESENYD